MDLKQKTVIVTGGAMGIGEACAKLLAESGANVIIADFNEEAGRKTAERIGCDFFSPVCDHTAHKYSVILIISV